MWPTITILVMDTESLLSIELVGIPVLVLGNKRDLPGALDEHGLIEKMNLNAIQVITFIKYINHTKDQVSYRVYAHWSAEVADKKSILSC